MFKFHFWIFIFLCSCYAKLESNFNLEKWEAVSLDGKIIRLSELNFTRLVLNVYSPDCIPCVKEIPTLNYLHNFISIKKDFKLYMVVDPYDIIESSESEDFAVILPKAIQRMKKEVADKKINLEVLVMKKPFRVDSSNPNSLITGRPETLILKTFPLVLYYNFIGAISEANDISLIEKDDKVLFLKKILGGLD